MNSQIASDLNSGLWAYPSPAACPCRYGWMLSDFDTWHRCPVHGNGMAHPESMDYGDEDPTDAEWAEHDAAQKVQWLFNCRRLFKDFAEKAVAQGLTVNEFNALAALELGNLERTPTNWVDAAWNALGVVARLVERRKEDSYWDRQREEHLGLVELENRAPFQGLARTTP